MEYKLKIKEQLEAEKKNRLLGRTADNTRRSVSFDARSNKSYDFGEEDFNPEGDNQFDN